MRFCEWDWAEWLLFLIALGGVSLLALGIIGAAHVRSTCKATDDTRTNTTLLVPVGQIWVAQPVRERRFICPGGEEVWL
jgi:hypothetical protein